MGKFKDWIKGKGFIPIAMITSAFVLYGTSVDYHQNIARADVSHGSAPFDLNHYKGSGANFGVSELLTGSGSKGTTMIISLDNGPSGASYIGLNNSGELTKMQDAYGARAMGANESSLAFVGTSVSNNDIFNKYTAQYWGTYSDSTYNMEDMSSTHRMIRSNTGSSVDIKDPYFDTYWYTNGELNENVSTSDLLKKNSKGEYAFEAVVNTVSQQTNREIWCTLADMDDSGKDPQEILNSKWFDIDTSMYNDTKSMSQVEKQRQSLKYIDMLMSLYSASKGTATESEWRNAIINYLTSNGGSIGQNTDNKTNIVFSRGLIWGTEKTEGVSNEDYLTCANGADLVSFLYRIDLADDTREPAVAEEYYKKIGADLTAIYKNAWKQSRANGLADGFWRDIEYWNKIISSLVGTSPEGASFALDKYRALDTVSVNSSKGAHKGISVINNLPLSVTRKSQVTPVKAFWSIDNVVNVQKTELTFGNAWTETDDNKMYNRGSKTESQSLRYYKDSTANSKKLGKLVDTINENIGLSINGKFGSNIDANNIIDNNDVFTVRVKITRNTNASNPKTVDYYLAGNQYRSDSEITLDNLNWDKDNLRQFLLGQKNLDILLDKSTKDQIVKNGTTVNFSYSVVVTVSYGTSSNDMTDIVIKGDSNKVYVTRKDVPILKGGIHRVEFHSIPVAYSELKEGTVQMGDGTSSNETWEAMAGVPSTESLYFTAGGSEFIAEVHMSYIPKERAKRYYHTHFSGTDCEYKTADQAGTYSNSGYSGGNGLGWIYAKSGNDGGGGTQVIPTINKNFGSGDAKVTSENYTFNVHSGGSVSVTISGTIHNDAPATVEADGMGEATANNPHKSRPADMQSRVTAYNNLKKWATQLGGTVIYYTASSDNVTRAKAIGTITSTGDDAKLSPTSTGLGSISVPSMPTNEPADTSAYDGWNSHTEGEGESAHEVLDPAHASAPKGADVPWSVTVTVNIPAHVLCGPCCEHTLPAIEDNWTQVAEYSYMRIDSARIWKIDRAYVDGMNEVTYTKQNNVVADLAQGEPTLWYNIADENKDYYNESKSQLDYYAQHGELQKKVFATHPARAGRIIYALEPKQYDSVSWNEGTRSNRCNGDTGCYTRSSYSPFPVSAGSGRRNIKNTHPASVGSNATAAPQGVNDNDYKGQCFSIGCLYSNTNRETNDETWIPHQLMGDKMIDNGYGKTTNKIDRYDLESPEFLRFKNRRCSWNYIIVESDMLVLQTTQGDQSIYYYPSVQWREADNNFDYDDDAAMGKNCDDIGSTTEKNWYQWFVATEPDGIQTATSSWYTFAKIDDNKNTMMDEGHQYGSSMSEINAPILSEKKKNSEGKDVTVKSLLTHQQTIQGYRQAERGWVFSNSNSVSMEKNTGEELYGYGLDYLYKSYESMWDNNDSSASKWDPQYTINISGYNGNVSTPKNKFSKHLTDDFDTLFDGIGSWEHGEHINDSSNITYYTEDLQKNHLGNEVEILEMIPNIDSSATDDGSQGDNQNIREFLNCLTDKKLDMTGNNVVVEPTDGSGSRFRGISGDGSPENVIDYTFSDVNPPDGHYIRSNFNKAKYENGEWNKDIDSMDSNDYEYKTTMYRSSPFTTNSASSGLDGMTDTVGSIHHQARVDRPSSSLKILVDRVHPWAVQNGWNKDKKTYQHGIRQDATNENREYTVGNGHVFYRQILNYTRPAIETGKYEFKYNYSNTTVSALGNKSGVVVDAPYSKNHNSINSIVVHDPVSVDGAFLIGLDSKRDQRTDGSGVSSAASMLEKLEASKICPGTAALCEFRHLDCKYFKEVDIANFKIEPSRIINTKNGVAYSYPNMITYDSDEEAIKFKKDCTTSIDVPFSDLGIEFSNSMTIKADFSMKMDEDTKKAIDDTSDLYYVTPIGFNRYSIMVYRGQIIFNTSNGVSYTADAKNLFDNQWHDYNVEFSFDDVANSKLTIDGKEITLVKKQEASDITSSLVGDSLKIGRGGIKQAPYLLKNIQLTKLSGTAHHTKSCYKEVTVHSSTVQYVAKPQKFSFTGDTQHFTVPETGRYLIQAYGASGGDSYGGSMDNYSSTGGLGGYATGIAYLNKGEVLDVVVGGQGTATSGGYPCGGKASSNVYGGGCSSWVLGNRVYVESQIGSTSSNSYIKNGKVKYAPVSKTPMRKNQITISVKGEGLDDRQIRIVGLGDGTRFAVIDKYTPSNNKYVSKSVDKHDEVTFVADITKEVLDFKVQVYYTSSKTRVDSVTISSSMCPIIEAGGGGGAGKTGQNAAKGSSVDNSGGAGGGVQGGAPRKNGTVVTASAGKLGNPYTGEGIGAGYYYGLPSGGTGGSGGGSSFVAGLEQPYTAPGVNCGNGEVIITSLEPQNAPDSIKKTIQSKNNVHVHTADCVTGANKVDFKNNAALIGAFYQDTYGDSTALKQILGTTLYNKYKSSSFNQTLKTGTMTYNYTGKVQKLSIPEAGLYTFDVYGASGGGANGTGGKGGHVTGSMVLQPKDNIYLYVGQQGQAQQSTANGTYYGAYMGGGVGSIRAYGGGGMSLVTTDPKADTIREYAKKEVKTVTYDEVDPTKGTLLASDDDSGSGLSARLSVTLTKGTKYLFCIGAYSSDRHGTYSWTFTGPSTNLSGTDKVDAGAWSNKTFDVDCVHTFTAPATGTYTMNVREGSGDPCAYVTTYATTKKSKTTEVYDTNHSGRLNKTKALLVGAGGGGATNSGARGGNSQNSQNGNTAQGDGNGQSVSRQVISSPQTKSFTLSEPIYVKCADGVGRYLTFEGGNTGTITLNKSHNYVLANHASGCTYGTSEYRNNGWFHIFDTSNSNKCITCGHTCGYDASTAHPLNIKVTNLFREVDKNKYHDGFLDSCGGGGGGSGYVGGNSGATETASGYGGVNFVGNSATKIASVEAGNTGNGKIVVNYTSSASLQTIYNAITNVIAPNVSLAPLTVNGGTNPLFICDGTFNQHKCDANCKTERILACSEPHHRSPASHYPGSNPVCWAPCGHTDPDDPNNPHAHNHDEAEIDGAMKRLGTFVNVDYKFQIYFPNIGDFEQNPNLRGLSAVTDIRGKSYADSMDTTKWIREKRVKFGFDVLFKNTNTGKWEEYKAGSWISLPIFKDQQTFDKQYSEFSNTNWFKENAMEVYDFYCLGSNVDIASASIQYEAEAVNAEGSPGGKSSPYLRKITNRIEERNVDNTSYTSNRTRNVSLMAKHSASKKSYADVVGRIGNLFITDTDDLRFANFFKQTTDTGWLIDGVIRKVNQAVQNNYLSWHTHDGKAYEDIRGELVKPETGMYNTWMMQNWLEDKGYMLKQDKYVGSTSVELPLTSAKNNITQLLGDKFKPGYNVLFEISTLGSYSDKLQVLPYFYALDTEHDKLYPVDVYMEADTEYVPINYYNGLPKSSDSEELKKEKQKLIDEESDYVLNLDWVREAERRNYTAPEKLITTYITDNYSYLVGSSGIRHPLLSPDTILGTGKKALGTVQLLNVDGNARTFIGSTYTQRENFNKDAKDNTNTGTFSSINYKGGYHFTNLDNLIYRDRFWTGAQRWHLKLGLPSSAVFVKYYNDNVRHKPTDLLRNEDGTPKTDENGSQILKMEEVQNGKYAILMTADIYAYGDTFILHYDQGVENGVITINGKKYTFGDNFNGQEIKGTVLGVYDADSTSTVDIDIQGSH